MSNLEQHIASLLVQHNCVILPRFGGLIGSYQPAQKSEESGMIAPPYKEIIFNRSLSHNDGLLIKSYSIDYNLSYVEAERQVVALIDSLQSRIAKGESVVFGEIGVFRMDGEGNIYFKQSDTLNLLDRSFGFEAIQMVPLSVGAMGGFNRTSKSKIFVKLVSNRRVTSVIAASITLFLFSTNVAIKELENYNYGSLFSKSGTNEVVAQLSTQNDNSLIVEPISPAVTEKKEEPKVAAVVSVAERQYHLIAASVTSSVEAEEVVQRLRLKGKTNAQVVKADGRYRISVEQFESKDLALVSMKSYRKNEQFKNVWVYRDK
jgi:hypothetical protein